jgi:hypothetical protein
MSTDSFKSGVAALVVVASMLGMSGCADKASPDNVDRRSVERWNLLVAHDGEKAYDYLSPGFRSTQTREIYAKAMSNRPIQWKAAKFNHKECDADRCKVYVDVTYSVKLPNVGKPTDSTSTQEETWILVNGEWYFLPK